MKSASALSHPLAIASASMGRARAADYVTLTKPRIVFMALVTVLAGALLTPGAPGWGRIAHALLGTALVAAGSSALNQWWERDLDARMGRTAHRPLPAGRMEPAEALAFGALLSAAGVACLAATTNLVAAGLAAAAWAGYVLVYTPLKRVTTLNTVVGAVPGALPALIGWAAVRGAVEPTAWGLFAIVFLWQFPHFLSIASLYRDEYERAGLKMLAATPGGGVPDPMSPRGSDPCPGRVGRAPSPAGLQAASYALALLPVSLLPSLMGATGPAYFFGALALGAALLTFALRFALAESAASARHLLRASIVYLPTLMTLLMLDRV